jgi:hypothetical protein
MFAVRWTVRHVLIQFVIGRDTHCADGKQRQCRAYILRCNTAGKRMQCEQEGDV